MIFVLPFYLCIYIPICRRRRRHRRRLCRKGRCILVNDFIY